jgi:hypothetical protein
MRQRQNLLTATLLERCPGRWLHWGAVGSPEGHVHYLHSIWKINSLDTSPKTYVYLVRSYTTALSRRMYRGPPALERKVTEVICFHETNAFVLRHVCNAQHRLHWKGHAEQLELPQPPAMLFPWNSVSWFPIQCHFMLYCPMIRLDCVNNINDSYCRVWTVRFQPLA